MYFNEKLKHLREQNRLTQLQFAKIINASQSAIARWELGKSEPTVSALIILSKFFNETVDYILGLED